MVEPGLQLYNVHVCRAKYISFILCVCTFTSVLVDRVVSNQ